MSTKQIFTNINPYYSLGLIHNNCLNYVATKIKPGVTVDIAIDKIYEYIISISPDKTDLDFNLICKAISGLSINQIVKEGVKSIPFNPSFLQKKYFEELFTIFDYSSIETITAQLKDLEKRILYSELSIKEQEPLLQGIAVGISSFDYWRLQYENYPKSPWKDFCKEDVMKKNASGWGSKDLMGAVVGGLIGSEIFGIGGLIGAAIGAAAASAAAVLTQSSEE